MSILAVLQNNYEVRSPSDAEITSYSSSPTLQLSIFNFISVLALIHVLSETTFLYLQIKYKEPLVGETFERHCGDAHEICNILKMKC